MPLPSTPHHYRDQLTPSLESAESAQALIDALVGRVSALQALALSDTAAAPDITTFLSLYPTAAVLTAADTPTASPAASRLITALRTDLLHFLSVLDHPTLDGVYAVSDLATALAAEATPQSTTRKTKQAKRPRRPSRTRRPGHQPNIIQ